VGKEPFYIFKTFFLLSLGLLGPVLLVFALHSYRVGIVGVLLGWSGMQIYLFFLLRAVSVCVCAAVPSSSRRRIQPHRAAFLRILFLLVFLALGGLGQDMAGFIWTLAAALSVYLCWLAFLVYCFFKST